MQTLEDYVRWIAKQNVINLDDVQINKLTRWLINNKQYQELFSLINKERPRR